MAYKKTFWKDRIVEKPNTYRKVENTDGTITLYPVTGQVIEQGTPVSAANLNKLENGIVEVYKELDTKIDEVSNKGTTVEVIERVTKQEIDRQIADGNMANLTIANGSITKEKLDPNLKFGVEDGEVTPEKTNFIIREMPIVTVNKGLFSSNGLFYYKQPTQENYKDFNLFLMDVRNISELTNLTISGGTVVRVVGVDSPIDAFKNRLESITNTEGFKEGTVLIATGASYQGDLNVSQYDTLAIYVGTKTSLNMKCSNKDFGNYKLDTNIKLSVDSCDFFKPNIIKSNEEAPLNFNFITDGRVVTPHGNTLACFQATANYKYQTVMLNLVKGNAYHFVGTKLSRCRVGVFFNKKNEDLKFARTVGEGSIADEVIYNDDNLNTFDFTYIPSVDSCICMYLSTTGTAQLKVSFSGTIEDGLTFSENVRINSRHISINSVFKSSLAFDFDKEVANTVKKVVGGNGIVDTSINDIDLIYEFPTASNEWACESRGLKMTSDEFLDLFYNKHLGYHTEDGLRVNKKILGKDQSGQYDIYEYDFIPAQYSRTILLSGGLHPYENSASFGLAHFMQEYMKYPYASDGFAYLRQNVRIKLIGIANPWGWNQRPMKYGNCRGVNPNRNFDLIDINGNSVWEAYEGNTTEWNQKGKAPWSEVETCMLRDWILDNSNAEFWIDCHTGERYSQYDNWIVTVSANANMSKIDVALKTLEKRIFDKYGQKSRTWRQIDHANSIKQKWGCIVAKVPTLTIEQAPENTLWGTKLSNESGDITEYAVTVYAYILAQLRTNL